MTRLACVLTVIASMSVTACGGGGSDGSPATSGGGGTPGGGGGPGGSAVEAGFNVFPKTIFTGFDGMHTYKAPVIAVSEGEVIADGAVTWTLSDPSIGELTTERDGVMITAKKSGSATLTATHKGQTATASLTVYAYTAAAYAEGEQR